MILHTEDKKYCFVDSAVAGMPFESFCKDMEPHKLSKEQLQQVYDGCKAAVTPATEASKPGKPAKEKTPQPPETPDQQ